MASDFVEIALTCEGREEAERIARSLLDTRLVAGVEFSPTHSMFWWRGTEKEVRNAEEFKLTMLTVAENFDRIEAEVRKLHSYETFVLQMNPIQRINKDAADWVVTNVR